MESPIDLLQTTLLKLLSAKKHSEDSFKKGDITKNLHEIHLENLEPLIQDYKDTIKVLTIYGK